ncbi:MAG: hypothetical protein OXF51_09955 [Alphaproteobacteria bacterium]|nr:hypothetical protein [Alphaproteobacteria bacterium]
MELITPDPSRQYGTGAFDLSDRPNSVIDRRRLSPCQRRRIEPERPVVIGQADKPPNTGIDFIQHSSQLRDCVDGWIEILHRPERPLPHG